MQLVHILLSTAIAVKLPSFYKSKGHESAEWFDFAIDCGGIPTQTCAQATEIIKRAGRKVAGIFNFNTAITVVVNFIPFKGPRLLNLAFSAPNMQAIQNQNGQPMLYPQALLKQGAKYNFPKADIEVILNENGAWYVGPEGQVIPSELYDLEFLVVHELVHGLGFLSCLSKLPTAAGVNFLVPLSFHNKYFAPPSVYDSLLYQGGQSVLRLISDISTFYNRVPSSNIINEFENTELFDSAKRLYKMLTSNQLVINLPDQSVLSILSPDPFIPSKSGSHLTPDYFNTPEYLIAPRTFKGVSLNLTMAKNGISSVYGPKLVQVFELMGYSTKANPRRYKRLELVAGFRFPGYLPTTKPPN